MCKYEEKFFLSAVLCRYLRKLFLIMTFPLFACSERPEENFVILNSEEMGFVNQKVLMRDLVNIVSKDLPVTIDRNTVWVGFTKGTELGSVVYGFMFVNRDIDNYTISELEIHRSLQLEQIENDYCTNPAYRLIRESGISAEYRFSDKNHKYLFSAFNKDFDCR